MAIIITPADAAKRLEDGTALYLDIYQLQIGRARLKAFSTFIKEEQSLMAL